MAIALDGAPTRHSLKRRRQINWLRLIALALNLLVWSGVATVVKAFLGSHY
jgi:hypothetical protein